MALPFNIILKLCNPEANTITKLMTYKAIFDNTTQPKCRSQVFNKRQ